MSVEMFKSTLDQFYTSMVSNPTDFGLLLFLILVLFFFLRKISGNSSRENWYKEGQLLARKNNQDIGVGGEIFLKSRVYSRWIYRSISILLVVTLPFSYGYLLAGLDTYGPVLLDRWYILIGVYILYRVLIMLNALMNLKLLSKELEDSRNEE